MIVKGREVLAVRWINEPFLPCLKQRIADNVGGVGSGAPVEEAFWPGVRALALILPGQMIRFLVTQMGSYVGATCPWCPAGRTA